MQPGGLSWNAKNVMPFYTEEKWRRPTGSGIS